MNQRPPYHLGYSPHSPYGELGFSFKKTLKRIKKEAEAKAKKVASSPRGKETRSFLTRMTKDIKKKMPPSVKKKASSIKAPSWMPKNMRKALETKAAAAKKRASTSKRTPKDGTKLPFNMVLYKGKPIPKSQYERIVKAKRAKASKPKAVTTRATASRERRAKPVRGKQGRTGARGKIGPRGYPGRTGPAGPRGPPGQSIASTERWKHKLEKDRLMAAYRNQQRLGRERMKLQQAQVAEMKKRNAILTQRISEQELMAKERMDNATVYNQWKSLKDAAQETIFPNLGGIDIEDEYVASSVSVLPWVVLGIALITREG